MTLMDVPHVGFIVAAYAVAALVLGGTVLAVMVDYRAQRQMLERLGRRLPAQRPSGSGDDDAD